MNADTAGRRQLEALGELIRSQRQQAELTLRELAARTNVSNPYLSQIERGLHEPSVRVLKAIAGALNLSAESLLQQAGILEATVAEPTPPPPTIEQAVRADPRLSNDQRAALLSVYRSFIGDDQRPAKKAAATQVTSAASGDVRPLTASQGRRSQGRRTKAQP